MVTNDIVLGHIVSSKGVEVDKSKMELIANLPTPKFVKDVRSFLGHAGFYRRFIKVIDHSFIELIVVVVVVVIVVVLLFIIYTINLSVVRPRSCRVIYYFDTPALGRRHQSFGCVTDLCQCIPHCL